MSPWELQQQLANLPRSSASCGVTEHSQVTWHSRHRHRATVQSEDAAHSVKLPGQVGLISCSHIGLPQHRKHVMSVIGQCLLLLCTFATTLQSVQDPIQLVSRAQGWCTACLMNADTYVRDIMQAHPHPVEIHFASTMQDPNPAHVVIVDPLTPDVVDFSCLVDEQTTHEQQVHMLEEDADQAHAAVR